MHYSQKLLLVGGKGALGSAISKTFQSASWGVTSIDFTPDQISNDLYSSESKKIGDKYDAVISVAGGWVGGGIRDPSIFLKSQQMYNASVSSSLFASHIASNNLKEGGILVLTGADAAQAGTPGMIAYGLNKAATHHLTKSLALSEELPSKSTVACILPTILDTKSNRDGMPDADKSTWIGLEELSKLLYSWASNQTSRPPTGSLVKIQKQKGHSGLETTILTDKNSKFIVNPLD